MNTTHKFPQEHVTRISISLPNRLAIALDQMIETRRLRNRSQAIAEMIEQSLVDHYQEDDDKIMAGTITLIFDASRWELFQKLSMIQRDHVMEVVSSQHVYLEGNYIMDITLVQGPVKKLRQIRDKLLACKGVTSGGLTLTPRLMPPLHGHP
ncbi:MAG: ribbon-helix-helix protein, CopG family [Opitutales bacterium]|nr:ribbon-helix-helix protein, CopG family [Opitutales bacterium]